MHSRIVIQGATGSIGESTRRVVRGLGNGVRIVGLSAGSNWRGLAVAAAETGAQHVAIADPDAAEDLRRACPPGVRVIAGPTADVELISAADPDLMVAGIIGAAGLQSTLEAVRRGIDVALANKESLVVAGEILTPLARQTGARLIPVDSEHSAVFQCLASGRAEEVERIILTASGGPFRTWDRERIAEATLDEALRHPTWSMGPKITIDSASLMNKALEVIEATHLFGISPDRIEVLVHPESIVHSMVEFRDGSIIAQLGAPDMCTPIQYAITCPQRTDGVAQRLDWRSLRRLNFELPDHDRFPALALGYEAARAGGSAGAVLNAANEAAVELFRGGAIRFGRMAELIAETFTRRPSAAVPNLDELLAADRWARQEVRACLEQPTRR